MPVALVCPSCGRNLNVPENLLGKKIKCSCAHVFVAQSSPATKPAAPGGGTNPGAKPAAPRAPASAPAGPAAIAPPATEAVPGDADTSTPRKKKGMSVAVIVLGLLGGLFFLCGGTVIAGLWWLRNAAQDAAEDIRKELEKPPIVSTDKEPPAKPVATGPIALREKIKLNAKQSVESLAFLPDNKTLASTDSDTKEVRLWDTGNGQVKDTWKGNNLIWGVFSSPYTPDLVGVIFHRWVDIMDGRTGKERHTFEDSVHLGATFVADGKTVIACSNFQGVKVWDYATGTQLRTLHDKQQGTLRSFAAPSTGEFAATAGGLTKLVKIYDVPAGKPLPDFDAGTGSIGTLAFSPDGKSLAIALIARKDELALVNPRQATVQKRIATERALTKLAYAPNGAVLAAGTVLGRVRIYDSGTLELLAESPQDIQVTQALAFSHDGRFLAAGHSDGTIQVFELTVPQAPAMAIRAVAIAPLKSD